MTITSTTRRLISAYADIEQWQIDHIEAQLCCDFEEHLAWGVRLFEGLLGLEARAQSRALERSDEEPTADLDDMPALYAMWLKTSERCLPVLQKLKDWGYAVEGLDAFEKAIAEARWIGESVAIEAEIRPYGELLGRLAPENPAPERYGD